MEKIDNYFSEIGTFESYVGEIIIRNNNIILPVFNCQLMVHPLNDLIKKIAHLDYSYFIFYNTKHSSRGVYYNGDKTYNQINVSIENTQCNLMHDFLIEALDFNGFCQYWNWIIKAESFSLVVPDNFKIQINPFSKEGANTEFFRVIDYGLLFELVDSPS